MSYAFAEIASHDVKGHYAMPWVIWLKKVGVEVRWVSKDAGPPLQNPLHIFLRPKNQPKALGANWHFPYEGICPIRTRVHIPEC
jgi:hypothetical protein